ncbi:MAG: two-component sensor histidine kinase [Lachnospiraceae bacterium]|nr:two-component sensor histidine kinase [Lachnospiraceae bacterium]
MKKRINVQLAVISMMAVVVTVAFIMGIYYRMTQQQVMQQLQYEAELLADIGIVTEEKLNAIEDMPDGQYRITLIDDEGKVLWDNKVDESQMENHRERPEIADAFTNGIGQSMRHSYTLEKTTFYFAKLLENGTVLRISRESQSVLAMCMQMLPAIGICIGLLMIVCLVAARIMTKKLVAPIEAVAENLDNPDAVTVAYKEMLPFVTKIQQQHADLMKSSKMRRDFTANVSHELKTPLTVISGYAELMEHRMASEEDTTRFAAEIHRNADRLLVLINDILQLSELDVCSDSSDIVPMDEVDLHTIASQCVERLKVSAKKNQVTIEYEGGPAIITGNREMLEQVITNLCDNAIRYNHTSGKVWVTLKKMDADVYLSVKDNGIGIPKDKQERVFERFYRVDKSRSKASGGTGLGLAIVKHIVGIHKAKLEMTSEVGVGTEIVIRFSESDL